MSSKKLVFSEKEWFERNQNRSFPKLQNRIFHIPSEGDELIKEEVTIDDEEFEAEERARLFKEYVKFTEEKREARRKKKQQTSKQKRKKVIEPWKKKPFMTKEQENKKRELAKSGIILYDRVFMSNGSFYGGRRKSLEWNDQIARGDKGGIRRKGGKRRKRKKKNCKTCSRENN